MSWWNTFCWEKLNPPSHFFFMRNTKILLNTSVQVLWSNTSGKISVSLLVPSVCSRIWTVVDLRFFFSSYRWDHRYCRDCSNAAEIAAVSQRSQRSQRLNVTGMTSSFYSIILLSTRITFKKHGAKTLGSPEVIQKIKKIVFFPMVCTLRDYRWSRGISDTWSAEKRRLILLD